ncbi:hypothetical protein [Marinococcus luteus]|uniref:hypothetical protein n=1 Tax=Marinococcus luteus TaxID=1122204 RepID=UPI002ACCBA5D|nr:hypothetical protein [Marinococcus luteus]MDZ5784208.1 hypothetical protein [Marinococcus luteus]
MEEIVLGQVEVTQFKEVDIEYLLGLGPVKLEMEGIADFISNKRVLVTGGRRRRRLGNLSANFPLFAGRNRAASSRRKLYLYH